MIKELLYFFGFRKGYQFWSYLRVIEDHIRHFKNIGFSEFEIGRYYHGAYWIRFRR